MTPITKLTYRLQHLVATLNKRCTRKPMTVTANTWIALKPLQDTLRVYITQHPHSSLALILCLKEAALKDSSM